MRDLSEWRVIDPHTTRCVKIAFGLSAGQAGRLMYVDVGILSYFCVIIREIMK